MSYELNWLPDAEITFNQNIIFLENEWNEQVLTQFLDRVDIILRAIRDNPFLFPIEYLPKQVRKCVVNKRIVLYYRIVEKGRVDLLLFWNTYQNQERLSF